MLNRWGFYLFSAWLPGNKSSQPDMSQCNQTLHAHRQATTQEIPAFSRSKVTEVAAQRDISNRRTYTWCSRVSIICAPGTKEAKTHSRATFEPEHKRGNILHMLNPSHPLRSASWKHRWKPGLNRFNEDKLLGQQPEPLICGRECNSCTTLTCSSSAGNLL